MTINMVKALNKALLDSMSQDDNVVVMGQDVGKNGGVFRVTEGLYNRFGSNRVIDTPISEALLGGMPIGMAVGGLKPIVEFQFMGFLYPAIDQIANHATRLHHRTQGKFCCPIVYRAPYGGGIGAPEHHSESFESMLAHIPGLRILIPSTPQKAYHLLIDAINDPNPVLFLEPKRIYRSVMEELDTRKKPPLSAHLVAAGTDLTVIGWGAALYDAILATQKLQISADIIDLCSIKPIDWNPIIASVEKTKNAVVVQESSLTCSLSSEISARIHEHCFHTLNQPVRRIAAPDAIVPFYIRESAHIPSIQRIMEELEDFMESAQ